MGAPNSPEMVIQRFLELMRVSGVCQDLVESVYAGVHGNGFPMITVVARIRSNKLTEAVLEVQEKVLTEFDIDQWSRIYYPYLQIVDHQADWDPSDLLYGRKEVWSNGKGR